ncbi:uncharacterized protein [Lepisosteus oculatus]|uniref:uncharacterized protein isoform X2 n=1 Tax=Lepisosteus oculatus TaxID=7918 RepID=UPI00370FB1A2
MDWAVLWALLGVLSAVAQSEPRQRQAAVGGSVVFDAPVLEEGSLKYGADGTIAAVFDGKLRTDYVERLRGRVTWDSHTGFFQIEQLNTQDTGVYTVDNKMEQKSVTVFNLHVYRRVSQPRVRVTDKGNLPDRPCTVQCSVQNGKEVTLSWQREGETLLNTSSPDLDAPLTLPLDIRELMHTYYCVSSNPVSTERRTMESDEYCAVTQQLEGQEGQAVSFSVPVLQEGSLRYGGLGLVAEVSGGRSELDYEERFRQRLSWDSQTGFFQVTNLNKQDAGVYTVDIKDGGAVKFHLTVSSPPTKPLGLILGMSVVMVLLVAALAFIIWYRRMKRRPVDVTVTRGDTFTFPFSVMEEGSLAHPKHRVIARVTQANCTTVSGFKDRVSWDGMCGVFRIADMQAEDAGIFKVKDQKRKMVRLNLKVRDPSPSRKQAAGTGETVELPVGGSYSFPISVLREGTLSRASYGPLIEVSEGKSITVHLRGVETKVTWSHETGEFAVSPSSSKGYGEYTVEDKKGQGSSYTVHLTERDPRDSRVDQKGHDSTELDNQLPASGEGVLEMTNILKQ